MAFAPLVLAIVVGTIVGVSRGGRVAALSGVRFASIPLVVIAVIGSVAIEHLDLPAPGWIALGYLVMALVFAFRNIRLAGMAVVSLGIIANLVPIVLNGATPVRPEALIEAGMVDAADIERVTLSGPYELSDADTSLALLGDTIPLPFANQVVSFGDLIILLGIADVLANLLARRRRPTVSLSALASLEAFGWHEAEKASGSAVELRAELRSIYPEDEGEVVRVFANTSASPAQDCGIAPPPPAESPPRRFPGAPPRRTAPGTRRRRWRRDSPNTSPLFSWCPASRSRRGT